MTTENETTTSQRKGQIRLLLLLLPGLLVVTSLALLVVSPFSWGAGAPIEMSDWMPPVIGVTAGLGALWVGLAALRKVARATRGDFEVFALQLVFGTLMFIAGSGLLLSLIDRLPDASTYEAFLDDDGEPPAAPAAFFVFSLIWGAFNIGWVWVGSYLYSNAISNQEPNRISRRDPDEVDGVGALLRERN